MPTLTITLTTEQAQRVATGVGEKLRLGRAATLDEVREELIKYLRSQVRQGERKAAERTARESLTDLGNIT